MATHLLDCIQLLGIISAPPGCALPAPGGPHRLVLIPVAFRLWASIVFYCTLAFDMFKSKGSVHAGQILSSWGWQDLVVW